MILGMGHDMVDIRRIEQAIARHGEAFLARVFTPTERQLADARPGQRAATYARRFAAKEAASKALGTGLRGMRWVDIEVLSGTQGKPELALHAASQQRLQALLPDGHAATLHLSLSDEFPYASAWVIIEARHA